MSMRPINEQHTEQSLKMAEAEITLWEQKHRTWMAKAKFERKLVESVIHATNKLQFAVDAGGCVIDPELTRCYLQAHKAYQEAEGQIMELQIAKLKSQATIYKAMLEEARNPTAILAPGGIKM